MMGKMAGISLPSIRLTLRVKPIAGKRPGLATDSHIKGQAQERAAIVGNRTRETEISRPDTSQEQF